MNDLMSSRSIGQVHQGTQVAEVGWHFADVDDPICPACRRDEESVYHFLLACPAHNGARRQLQATLGREAGNIHTLLATRKGIKATLKYVTGTKRFKRSFGAVDADLSDDERRKPDGSKTHMRERNHATPASPDRRHERSNV